MVAEGYQVASHGFSHLSLWSVPQETQISELVQNEDLLLDVLGFVPTYFRCPYLECDGPSGTLGLLGDYGYHVIGTNVDTKDYMYDAPDQIWNAKDNFANLVSGDSGSNSYISLTHDIKYQTVVELTRYMIETARARGYQLVTVGECLGDDRANWYRSAEGNAVGAASASTSSRPVPTTLVTSIRPTSSATQSKSTTIQSSSTTVQTTLTTIRTTTTALQSTSTVIRSTSTAAQSTSTATQPTSTPGISLDVSCGGANGFTCTGSKFGECCSKWGWW